MSAPDDGFAAFCLGAIIAGLVSTAGHCVADAGDDRCGNYCMRRRSDGGLLRFTSGGYVCECADLKPHGGKP